MGTGGAPQRNSLSKDPHKYVRLRGRYHKIGREQERLALDHRGGIAGRGKTDADSD